MKAIINGKKYDTETAKLIGSYSYSNSRDFAHFKEDLYLKKTGEFFLVGKGGPASKYRRKVENNMWSGDVKIVPLSIDDAKKWVEENCSIEEYEDVFGVVEE